MMTESQGRAPVDEQLDEGDVDRRGRGPRHGLVDRGDELERVALLADDVLDGACDGAVLDHGEHAQRAAHRVT